MIRQSMIRPSIESNRQKDTAQREVKEVAGCLSCHVDVPRTPCAESLSMPIELPAMIKPREFHSNHLIRLHGGRLAPASDVWDILSAAAGGDLPTVMRLVDKQDELLTCQYDYTSPLHLAVREGQSDVVRFLIEKGALDPRCHNHPFLEPIAVIARDRGYNEITTIIETAIADSTLTHEWSDVGGVVKEESEEERQFQYLVDQGKALEVETMLVANPQLAKNNDAFWFEGILAMPAHDGNHEMIDLLMKFGALVPEVSKWGARYYFERLETASYLLDRSMNPNHMNWRRFTLLHDMAHEGDLPKAQLLIAHGADLDAIDDEYQSTPLGYAAHFGRPEIVELLLHHGAQVNRAGAPFAQPLAWAERNGHTDISALLRRAGAVSVS